MVQPALLAKRPVVSEQIVALARRQRPPVGARSKTLERFEVCRLRVQPGFLYHADRRVDAREVLADGFLRHIVASGFRLFQVGVADAEDRLLRCDLRIGGPKAARLPSTPFHFAALVEIELYVSPGGEIGDGVKLQPQHIELFPLPLVEDQLHQRRVIAEIAHHVVKARAQQATLVFGIVGVVSAALANVESVRKHGGETGE